MTSDERIEIAAMLRHAIGIKSFVTALGIDMDSDWYWTDVSDRVADLIDPTCTAPLEEHEHGWLTRECSECSYTIKTGNKYCPNCGARVVR